MKSRRGFASMDPEKVREIASKGGRACQRKGTGHSWTSEEAAAAGRKGGRVISADREHMRTIGRKGGTAVARANARDRVDKLLAEHGGSDSFYAPPSTEL